MLVRGASLLACAAFSQGCMTSHGLLQTAHTKPPGRLTGRAGAAQVHNSIDDQGGRSLQTNTTADLALRGGLTEFMELGLAPLLGGGAALEAKANLLDNRRPAAVAPRVSFGYAQDSRRTALVAETGLIGSYRFLDWLEPYVGVQVANHWFESKPTVLTVEQGQQYAESSGLGDGLLKTSIGLELGLGSRVSALAEYGHWFTLHNDLGDGYTLLPTHLVAAALAVTFGAAPASAPGAVGSEELARR